MIRIPSHAPDISEASLQRLILGRLVTLPGVAVLQPRGELAGDPEARAIFWRQNVVVVKGEDRFVRSGVPGQPDVVGVVIGTAYGIEVKRARGKQSTAQRAFEERFTRAGGVYIVARTLSDALVPVCRALELPFEVEACR